MSNNIPIAKLCGEPIFTAPKDLFIPPHALQIVLTEFEGPLDFLLYLIRKQNIDILNIPLLLIIKQYLSYVQTLQGLEFGLAAEYLFMAGILLDIKSKLLLPQNKEQVTEEEVDPKVELIKRLIEYEQMKNAAESLQKLPVAGRDFMWVTLPIERTVVIHQPVVSLESLTMAWLSIMQRAHQQKSHQIQDNKLSVEEQSKLIVDLLKKQQVKSFQEILQMGLVSNQIIVVTFIALLELIKAGLIEISQETFHHPIFINYIAQ